MGLLAHLIAGAVFGVGLVLSGMTNPNKVLNFLDPFGFWDPSLIFVMAGAIAVTAIGYAATLRRERPVFNAQFYVPSTSAIDQRLIVGASIFGLGWGLVGLCPGPAIASLFLANPGVLAFTAAMVIGCAAAARLRRRLEATQNSDVTVAAPDTKTELRPLS